jgi:hypothetical protein
MAGPMMNILSAAVKRSRGKMTGFLSAKTSPSLISFILGELLETEKAFPPERMKKIKINETRYVREHAAKRWIFPR